MYGLESTDKLNVSVLKAYANNYLVINRGLEDGIDKGDHIKLTNKHGYIARAICVKTSMLISNWKVYRVVRPELLSFDSTYLLRSMNQSEIPKDITFLGKRDYSRRFNDFTDKDIKKEVKMQQKRIASFDLPNDMKDDPIFVEAKKTTSDHFMDKNFDADKFKKDLSVIDISLFASPFSFQSHNNQKDVNFGFRIRNNGEKYKFDINYNKKESVDVDPFTEEAVEASSTHTDMIFDIKNISENVSYFAYVSMDNAKIGNMDVPKDHTQIGPIGFRYHFIRPGEDETFNNFDISYIPLIDSVEYDENRANAATTESSKQNFRHGFKLNFFANISHDSTVETVLWYSPYMDLGSKGVDTNDTKTNLSMIYNWHLSEKLSTEVSYQYLYDITLFDEYAIDPMNQITTINLRYDFTL